MGGRTNRIDLAKWLVLLILASAALVNYSYMINYTVVMFASPLEDMSHGWVVPFFSAYVVWRQRDQWRAVAGGVSWAGVAFVAGALVLAFFGSRGLQTRMEQLSFILLVWSVPYALWGGGVARLMVFPAAFLLFTIPVSSFLDVFTIHLRMFSTSLATTLLNGVGILVERSGTALYSRMPGAEFNVDVADPCSGIRSLFAMMALTAAFAYFFLRSPWKRWVLFAFSIPVAIIGNMVRIMSICLVAVWFGQETALGYYHDYSGYPIFLVGVLMVFALSEWLSRVSFRRGADAGAAEAGAAPETARPAPPASLPRTAAVLSVLLVLVLGVFAVNRFVPPAEYSPADFVAHALPENVGEFTSDRPLFCQNDQCLQSFLEREVASGGKTPDGRPACPNCGRPLASISLGEFNDLPRDTEIVKRTYRSVDGLVYSASLVIGGHQRASIHRAELCLPAQGFVMQGADTLRFHLRGKTIRARRISAIRSGGAPFNLVYWFESRDRECCSHTERILVDVWDRSVHNRINRWIMLAVTVSSPLDSPLAKSRFEEFLAELYPQVVKKGGGR